MYSAQSSGVTEKGYTKRFMIPDVARRTVDCAEFNMLVRTTPGWACMNVRSGFRSASSCRILSMNPDKEENHTPPS